MVVTGISNAVLDVCAFTILQRGIPARDRMAVFGLLEGVVGFGIAIGGVAGSLAVEAFGPRGALGIAGAILPIMAVATWPWVTRIDARKLVAEREVERLIETEKLPAVIVAPSTPIGPRDIKPTPTGRVIVEAATGRMPAFVDTGLNLVHVDDVAQGHLLALDKGKIGENYILGGSDVALETMLGDIAFLSGRRAPTVKIPRGPLFPLAWGAEAVARVTGKEPFLTVDALRMSRYRMFFSSEKAKRELGYTARPYLEGLKDALGWFRDNGYLK